MNVLWSQKYFTEDIRKIADRVLKLHVGNELFKFCSFDKNTQYNYVESNQNSQFDFLNTKKTKGKFIDVEMKWNISIPNSKCPAYDTIKGQVVIYFNRLLQPETKQPINFIPNFYLNNDSCYFISEVEALSLARKQNLKDGIDSLKAILKFDSETKMFYWEVSQTIWKEKNQGEVEMVIIDPINREVKAHKFNGYQIFLCE